MLVKLTIDTPSEVYHLGQDETGTWKVLARVAGTTFQDHNPLMALTKAMGVVLPRKTAGEVLRKLADQA